jgi:hypothetical protein
MRALGLVDGEHYVPVVRDALAELPYEFVATSHQLRLPVRLPLSGLGFVDTPTKSLLAHSHPGAKLRDDSRQ